MKNKGFWWVAQIGVLVLGISTGAPAQIPTQRNFRGSINDFTPASGVSGPWEIRGQWFLQLKGESGKADFSASLTMVRSDLGVMLNGGGNLDIPTQRSAHTHSVATNCTGHVTVHITGGGTVTANTVADDGNKGFQIIDTGGISGGVAAGFSLAQGVVTCGFTGKKATFAANLIGKIPNKGAVAYVAQVILDGNGNVSGAGTFDVNGTIVTAPFTGTYTESANCTGTAQFTPSGFSRLNFHFVVVNAGKEILLLETDTNTVVGGYMQQ